MSNSLRKRKKINNMIKYFNTRTVYSAVNNSKYSVCVFQTSITLLWTLYELAKYPNIQEELRAEVTAARAASLGDVQEMLKRIPLIKGALKESLR